METDRIAARNTALKNYKTKLMISVVSIVLASMLLICLLIYIVGTLSEQKGMFEITTAGDGELSLSSSKEFLEPSTYLKCEPINNITNISEIRDIPIDVNDVQDGSHNGKNYFAYTFYLKNSGDVDIDIEERVDILGKFKDADQAIRVKIYRNDISITYAAPSKNGAPEYGTIPFLDEKTAYINTIKELASGETIKYTIVIWLEGDDPECKDEIKGGFVRFAMKFNIINNSEEKENKENLR